MKRNLFTSAILLSFALVGLSMAQAQGKGQGKGQGGQGNGQDKGAVSKDVGKQDKGYGQGKSKEVKVSQGSSGKTKVDKTDKVDKETGNSGKSASAGMAATIHRSDVAASRANSNARFLRDIRINDVRPSVRRFITSNNRPENIAAGAVAYALARGVNDRDFVITPTGKHIFVKNRKGDVLVDLDDDRARTLGNWRVNVLDDEVKSGSPSFCRSGAGHPVFGREWCLNKGFGLGTSKNWRWGETTTLGQTIVLQPTNPTAAIARDVLVGILGNTVTDRLALHAITLGLVDPLVGKWIGDPNSQRVLLVSSGGVPVAEFVDVNNDTRADRMLVALKPW